MVAAKVAIVEDDPAILELMTEVLLDEGYAVVSCTRGAEAPALILEASPALVILDMRMEQEETGWHVLAQLRQHERTSLLPVIFCSVDHKTLRAREQELLAGHCLIVEKPFSLDELLSTVSSALAPACASCESSG